MFIRLLKKWKHTKRQQAYKEAARKELNRISIAMIDRLSIELEINDGIVVGYH